MASKKKDLLNKILEENKSKDNYYSNNENNSITNKDDILKARDKQKKDSDFNELIGRDSGDKIPGVDSIINEETAANIDVFLDSSNDELVSMVGDEIESTNQNIIKDVNIDDILGFTNNKSDEIIKEIEIKDKEAEKKEKDKEEKTQKKISKKSYDSKKDSKENEIEFNLNNIDFSDLDDSDFPSYSKENEDFDFNELVEDATNNENMDIHSDAESVINKNDANTIISTDTEEAKMFDEEFIKSIEDNNDESRKNIKEEKTTNINNDNETSDVKKKVKENSTSTNTMGTPKNENNSNERRNTKMQTQNKISTNTTVDKNNDFYSRYISNFDSMLKDLANRFIDENIQNQTTIGNFDVSNSAVVLMYIKDKINQ